MPAHHPLAQAALANRRQAGKRTEFIKLAHRRTSRDRPPPCSRPGNENQARHRPAVPASLMPSELTAQEPSATARHIATVNRKKWPKLKSSREDSEAHKTLRQRHANCNFSKKYILSELSSKKSRKHVRNSPYRFYLITLGCTVRCFIGHVSRLGDSDVAHH